MHSQSTTIAAAATQSLKNRNVTKAAQPTAISSRSANRIRMLEVWPGEDSCPRRGEPLLAIFLGRLARRLSGPRELIRAAQKMLQAVGDRGRVGIGAYPAVQAVRDHVGQVAAAGHHRRDAGELGFEDDDA